MGKAKLEFHFKEDIQKHYVMEMKLYSVEKDRRFPDGSKYALVFIDKKSGSKVLFDNHHPKGHHYHLNDEEFAYDFSTVDILVQDFKKAVYQHFGVRL